MLRTEQSIITTAKEAYPAAILLLLWVLANQLQYFKSDINRANDNINLSCADNQTENKLIKLLQGRYHMACNIFHIWITSHETWSAFVHCLRPWWHILRTRKYGKDDDLKLSELLNSTRPQKCFLEFITARTVRSQVEKKSQNTEFYKLTVLPPCQDTIMVSIRYNAD